MITRTMLKQVSSGREPSLPRHPREMLRFRTQKQKHFGKQCTWPGCGIFVLLCQWDKHGMMALFGEHALTFGK